MLKCQRSNNNKSKKMASNIYKYQQFEKHNTKKKQSLDKYKRNSDNDKYIVFIYTTFLFSHQKEINRLLDLDKRIKNLIYLIYILKNC